MADPPFANQIADLYAQAQASQGAGLGPVQIPGRGPPQLVQPAELAAAGGPPVGPAGLPQGMDPRAFSASTGGSTRGVEAEDAPLTQAQQRAQWAAAATGGPPPAPAASPEERRKLEEQVDHERERLAKAGKLAPGTANERRKLEEQVDHERERLAKAGKLAPGTANPFAAARAAAAGGAAGAPPLDATAAGYRFLGDNPNDPRQVAAAAALAQEQAGTAGIAVAGAEEQAKANEAIEKFHREEAQRQRDEQIENAKAIQHQTDYVEASKAHYQARAADLAAQKIDPDQIFAGANGGFRRVIASIGAAMGAAGAVYGHTDNFAQKIIDSQIHNSIDAQKANMENKRAGVEAARGEYQMAREAGMDDAQARAVQRGLGNAAAAQAAEELAQKATSVQQRNAAMMVAQSARQAQAQAELDHTKAANAKGAEYAEARRKEGVAAANAGKKSDAAEAKVEEDQATATAASEALHQQIRETGGVEGYGPLGRLGRVIHPALTTEQTRADLRNVDRLAAAEAKDEKGRVNPEIKADILKNVRDEEDVKRFLSENDYRHRIAREAARRAGGSPGSRKSGEEETE
jgi:hypothetical protein